MLRTIIGATAFLATLSPARHDVLAAPPASARPTSTELRQFLEQIVTAGAPGTAARVVDERGVTQAGSGMADVTSGRPMRPALQYRVGSITKTFVATVVLQLVADGLLSLDDTVERWLPGILPYADQITVRQVLNHTAGIPEYITIPYIQLYTDPVARLREWDPRELVALVAAQAPLFPAGTAWTYSNTGYVLAGLIVEAVTGNGLDQEMKRRIFRPLGLRRTSFPVDRVTIPAPFARGYGFQLGQPNDPLLHFTDLNPSLAWAAGALISDLGDLQRFFRALLRGRLLPPALLTEMKTPFPTGRGFGYGLGLIVIQTASGPIFGHDGAIPGFHDVALNSEDGRRQVALVVNAEFATPAVGAAFQQVITTLDTRLFGATTAAAQ